MIGKCIHKYIDRDCCVYIRNEIVDMFKINLFLIN